jgi:hypothetical protein
MRTRLVKWLCIGMLFIAFVTWRSMADYELALRVVVCAGAVSVSVQAFRAARRRWVPFAASKEKHNRGST